MRIGAVVFDLDDTLIMEMDFVRSGHQSVAELLARRIGLPESEGGRLIHEAFRRDRRRVFDQLGETLRLPSSLIGECIALYRYHDPPHLAMPADAREALAWARTVGPIGLLTDGDPRTQRNKLRAAGLAHSFDAMVLTGELPPGCAKPSRFGFDLVAEQLEVAASRCVYVGDNRGKDFAGARGAGMTTVCIIRSMGIHCDAMAQPGEEPDATVTSLVALEEAIEGIPGATVTAVRPPA